MSSPHLVPVQAPRWVLRGLLGPALAWGLVGCANLPEPSALPPLQSAAGLGSAATGARYAQGTASWPTAAWWQSYADPQLNALMQEALQDSPDLAVAQARWRQSQTATQSQAAASQAQIGANASATEQKLSRHYLTPAALTPVGWNDFGRIGLDLNWDLDWWGKNRAALAAATSEQSARGAETAQARLLLTSGLASAYAEWARLWARLDLAQQAVAVRRQLAALTEQRAQHGLEHQGAVHEAQARLSVAEAQVLQVEQALGVQRHRLAAWTGAGPERGQSLQRPAFRLQTPPGLPSDWQTEWVGRRPDVVAARWQAQAQADRLGQKTAEFYPNVSLNGFIGAQSLGLEMLQRSGSVIGSLGPAISLPVFNGGRLRAEWQTQEARYAEAVARYNATLTHALQDVADVAWNRQQLQDQLAKSEATVRSARQAHQVARKRYEGGLSTYLEVLLAEDGVLNSIGTLSDLHTQAFLLDIGWQRALGGGYPFTPVPL